MHAINIIYLVASRLAMAVECDLLLCVVFPQSPPNYFCVTWNVFYLLRPGYKVELDHEQWAVGNPDEGQ